MATRGNTRITASTRSSASKKASSGVVSSVAPVPAVPQKRAARRPKAIADTVSDEMFEVAADTFRIMSAPMRLRIINSLCEKEKYVGQLLEEIPTTQPNMSQHLNALFKAHILGRRREGVQIYYRIINGQVLTICRAMCQHVATLTDPASDASSG